MSGETELVIGGLQCLGLGKVIAGLVSLITAIGSETVEVMPGWGSECPPEEQWIPVQVPVASLAGHIQIQARSGAFRLAASDLFVAGRDFKFKICHEGDLHFWSADPVQTERVKDWGKALGSRMWIADASGPTFSRDRWTEVN